MTLPHSDGGDGPPVILLHAGVADRRMWAPLADALGDGARLIAPDLRGFGEADVEPGATVSHPRDVLGLADSLGLGRFTLVGASYGGMIALEVAAAAPERVARLLLLAPALPDHEWSEPVTRFWEEEEAALEDGDLDAAVEANLAMWVLPGSPHRDLVADMQRRAFELQLAEEAGEEEPEVPLGERLHEVAAPTVVLTGELDVADFRQIARRVVDAVPRAELQEVADAGHLIALDRPEVVAAALRDLLPTT